MNSLIPFLIFRLFNRWKLALFIIQYVSSFTAFATTLRAPGLIGIRYASLGFMLFYFTELGLNSGFLWVIDILCWCLLNIYG